MKDAIFIGRKDLQYTLKSREALLWVFVMPIVFFYFIGNVTSGFGPDPERADRIAVRGDADAGFLAEQLIHRLEERNFAIVRPETEAELNVYKRRLVIPPAFTDSILAGSPTRVHLGLSESGLTNDYDRMRVGRAVYSLLADLVVAGETAETLSPELLDRLNSLPRRLTVDVSPAGTRKEAPSGFEQAIPGIMVMFILMVMATSGAVLLVIERRQGLLRRLAYTPISRPSVVLGKWVGKLSLGIIQIAFGMLAGTVIFKMNWGADLGWVVIVLVTYGAMMAALGLLLGNLARTEGQAIGIGVVAANVLAALGGCWWPIEITPGWMQQLQLFLPTGWAMDAMHKLISFGAGPASVLPHVFGMLLLTGILIWVSSRTFRFQ